MYRIFIFYFLLITSSFCLANSLKDWPNGPSNHKKILAFAVKEEKPMLVYFYTDWCSFCKRLNQEYINTTEFKELSNGVYKVQINPEKSNSGNKLFKTKYKGTGYPTVLVLVPGISDDFKKYHPFSKNNDMSPALYVNKIRETIARMYNNKAFGLFKNKQYKAARSYLYKALTYDLHNKYALKLIGMTYHHEGYEKQDQSLLDKARTVYKKALSFYPRDKEILENLSQLGD